MTSIIKTLKQTIIYQNKWTRLNEDEVEFSNGSRGNYAFIDRVDNGALVIPMTDDGQLILIKEWRYAIKDYTWCFPAGGKDYDGENSLDVAKRELAEEAGVTAKEYIDLGEVKIDPGVNSQSLPIYLARGLSFNSDVKYEESEDIQIHTKSVEEIVGLIRSGEINNGWTLACLMKLFAYLKMI